MTTLSDVRNGETRKAQRAGLAFTTAAWWTLLHDEASNFEFDTSWRDDADSEAELLRLCRGATVIA